MLVKMRYINKKSSENCRCYTAKYQSHFFLLTLYKIISNSIRLILRGRTANSYKNLTLIDFALLTSEMNKFLCVQRVAIENKRCTLTLYRFEKRSI